MKSFVVIEGPDGLMHLSGNRLCSLKELEMFQILAAVKYCHGNRRQAAEILGISLRALYYKLAELKK
jgi:DNA-binding NtrC family response regulator